MSEKLTHWLIILLISVSAISGFYIWSLLGSRGLDLQLEVPDKILIGVPFELKLNFSNNSGAVLNDARLALVLPPGAAFYGSPISKTIENKNLGNIGAGSLIQEEYAIIVFSPEAANEELKATINYASASLGARFEKRQSAVLSPGDSGIKLEIAGSGEAKSGEEFELNLIYGNISDSDFNDLELKLEYPASFSFTSASLKPDRGNNIWELGDLRKNSEGKLSIMGSLIGNAGDKFEIKALLSRNFGGESYPVSEISFPINLSSSPLSLSISVNGDPAYVAKIGDILNYTISYVNGTENPLSNAVIRMQLVGELFDIGAVQSQGFFRPTDNTIIWNSQNVPSLALIAPGTAGALNFSVKVKDNFPIRRFSDKNFVLYVNGEISSQNISTKARLETKVAGNLAIDAKAYFRDAESGILNQGPIPPKAGQKTNFTIHWQIKNFAADISNIEARAKLGNNVRMVGEPKSNSGSLPLLETVNNEVVWNIDKIHANQGVISSPIEAIFQVEAEPDASQAGSYLQLIGPTSAKATDDFTDQELLSIDAEITTALPDDPTIGQQGVVRP